MKLNLWSSPVLGLQEGIPHLGYVVLENKSRASCVLSKHSSTKLHFQPQVLYSFQYVATKESRWEAYDEVEQKTNLQ